ncbi:MAG: 5-formyltetrahydrofolate cyclo-ligase [Telmatospirillum sp.]|nr:5-formyltetrahydrofolate cyclo-ligase [Telmatospirillum sp.]
MAVPTQSPLPSGETSGGQSGGGGKTDLRREARALRRAAHSRSDGAAAGILRNFVEGVPWRSRAVIAGYWPISDEVDVRPLLDALAEQGCLLALPEVERRQQPLIFRRWSPGAPLEAGIHGTFHPLRESPSLRPDLVLVPLLAFDRRGGRLGYGGGYYDRTMAALRSEKEILTVGIAYAAQEMSELPTEPHDQRLDWIVTEDWALEALS